MATTFDETLTFGQMAESRIAQFLRQRYGCSILPAYEVEKGHGKGPRVWTPTQQLISPDMLVWCNKYGTRWVEAKHKSVFSWYRRKQQWETGVDARHYEDYWKLSDASPFPVWLLFLHSKDRCGTRDEPWPCPTGLYGQEIRRLDPLKRFGKEHAHGMYYWPETALKKLATIEEVET